MTLVPAFTINLHQSVSRRNQYAISITNERDESVVLGFTSQPQETMEAFCRLIHTESSWTHDPALNFHTLQVSTVVQPSSAGSERLSSHATSDRRFPENGSDPVDASTGS